ncbi:Transketolase, pyridine binding domain protein, partial [Actinomyces sp. oral taxon 171 str. F0337]
PRAEEHVPDRFHAVGQIHPETGLPVVAERFGWTSVFAEEIVSLARSDERIVGVTAAMQAPVGLQPLADAMPKRVIDVGIAEQHALTFSAGLAFAGMHPVVALYATFLNRAFDQVLMDVALHRAGVTIVLDRAGITGTDGASHNGMWDMALLAHVPGLRLAAPRDETTLRESLRLAVSIDDAPAVVRYPKGALPEPLTAVRRLSGGPDESGCGEEPVQKEALSPCAFDVVDVLLESLRPTGTARILLVGVGAMAPEAYEAGRILQQEDRAVTVVHPHWVIPAPAPLVAAAANADVVVVVEDGLVDGGIGSQLRDAVEGYRAAHTGAGGSPVFRRIGIPRQFIDTATRAQLMEDFGMRAADIAEAARIAADGVAGARTNQDLGTE